MRQIRWAGILLGLGVIGLSNLAAAQETPRAEQRAEQRTPGDSASQPARAVLQITSEAGTCYWSIAGDDDLVRLPQMKDERFSAILLSARFDNDQLHLNMAGEAAPLDTVSLGQLDLGLLDGSPVSVDSIREKSATKGGWQLRVLPPNTKVDTTGCCSCGIVKLSCCPNKAYCMGCGACGNCCG